MSKQRHGYQNSSALWECSRLYTNYTRSDISISCFYDPFPTPRVSRQPIMPQINVKTPSGPASFNYTISTPSSENASAIDPSLPTVLFLHPVYMGHVIFHRMFYFPESALPIVTNNLRTKVQFASPLLRRFNLIGMDMRAHGGTTGSVPTTFRREHAAEDVYEFMARLFSLASRLMKLTCLLPLESFAFAAMPLVWLIFRGLRGLADFRQPS